MTGDALSVIRAVVREELRGFKTSALGVVTASYPHESSGDQNRYQCDVRLRDTELELRRVAVATPRIGMAAIPDVGNLVLVHFLEGDPAAAVITGSLYNDEDEPPTAKARESVYVTPHSAESGIRRSYLELPNGNSLLLDDDRLVIEMGATKITVNHDGDVELQAAGAVKVTSDGDTTIEANGAVTLKAAADLSIEGLNVSVKAQASLAMQGTASGSLKAPSLSLAGNIGFSPA